MTMQISNGNNQGISKIRDFIESAESLGHDRSQGLNIRLHYILSNLSPAYMVRTIEGFRHQFARLTTALAILTSTSCQGKDSQ